MTGHWSSAEKWEVMAQIQIILQLQTGPKNFPEMLDIFNVTGVQQENQLKSRLAILEEKGLVQSQDDLISLDTDLQVELAELNQAEATKRIMWYLKNEIEE